MNITAQDILDLLPIVADRGWRADESGFIRDRKGRCPVCALVDEITGCPYKSLAHSAWEHAGYPDARPAVDQVMDAADAYSYELRPALMAALGMKP